MRKYAGQLHIGAQAEAERQHHLERLAKVNPIFVENDGLKNQNRLLLKEVESLVRQLDDANRHVQVLEQVRRRHPQPVHQPTQNNQESQQLRGIVESIKNDWKQVSKKTKELLRKKFE